MKTYEQRLQDAEDQSGKILPSFYDKDLEFVCRKIEENQRVHIEETWKATWLDMNDAYVSARGGPHSTLVCARAIIAYIKGLRGRD